MIITTAEQMTLKNPGSPSRILMPGPATSVSVSKEMSSSRTTRKSATDQASLKWTCGPAINADASVATSSSTIAMFWRTSGSKPGTVLEDQSLRDSAAGLPASAAPCRLGGLAGEPIIKMKKKRGTFTFSWHERWSPLLSHWQTGAQARCRCQARWNLYVNPSLRTPWVSRTSC